MRSTRRLNNFCSVDSAIRCALFVCVIWFCSFCAHAQQFTFIQYSLKEGLPQSQVRCMMQDSRGFIWIGTLGGLSKFDGRKFANYDRREGLLNNQINCLLELTNGSIAAGSNGSVVLVNGLGVESIPLGEGHRESTINALFEYNGQLWIGMENGLLCYSLSEKKFIEMDASFSMLADQHIKAFLLQGNAHLFILTKEKLYRHENGSLNVIFHPENKETTFFDIASTKDGALWLAAKGEGLIRLNPNDGSCKNFLDHPDLTTNLITGLLVDKDDKIWMTSRYGFYEYDGSRFLSYTEKNGVKSPDVRDIIEDREGNIWLGTYGAGILRFTGKGFSSYTSVDGLPGDAVMSIAQDSAGAWWFSTFDKGISRFSDGHFQQYNLAELTDNKRIWSSVKDHTGALWFGSSDGLFRYSNGQFKRFGEEDSISNTMILSLFEDNSKRLWIGTNKGLTTYENGKFSKVSIAGSPQKKVRCIRQDQGGHLWFAAIDGVFKFDGIGFTLYTQKDGLPENSSNCIEIDEQNRIWVGTQNGISVLSSSQFISSQIDDNSGSNVVNFLKNFDRQLWVGTNNGLFSIDLTKELSEGSLVFRHYGIDDGLRSMETNLNAVFIDDQKQFWFGTTEGVTILNTSELQKQRDIYGPLLNMVNVQINLQDVDWTKGFEKRSEENGLAVNPTFQYKQNHITFYFTGISTTHPGNVKYQYMLEGLDEDWKTATEIGFATYSNLPYKDFDFKVRAMSAEGMWSDTAAYSFRVKPPFWLTWWFILLEAITAISIVGSVIYNRRKALREKREKEWFEIKSKMLALEQQSLNSSMNRHFVFNALNSIQYYINRQDRLAANKYLSDFARLIRKNLDSSEDNLTTLRDEIERLELYMKLEHMRFQDKFDYTINVDASLNRDQIKVPAMLIQPFLENSIWHGLLPKDSQGRVVVDIVRNNGSLEFTITDNGIGIENSLKNKTTTDDHISKGMEITQSRIELIKKTTGQTIELHGPYQIHANEEGEDGTRVRILLPLNFHELFHP